MRWLIARRMGHPPLGGTWGGFSLNGLTVKEAIAKTKEYVTSHGLGRVKVNFRLRDAIFSRQRYWGEPFPVYYKDGMPYMIPESCLPLELPEVDKFLPTETGEPPLGNATRWAWDTVNNCVTENAKIDNKTVFPLELNTMPGFAGSSAYYLRYMDPRNHEALTDKKVDEYWQNVDLYVGGTEHATGHLIYSRFWNKFLFDYGFSCKEEPFQKLVNQGMIQGRSNFVYRVIRTPTSSPQRGESPKLPRILQRNLLCSSLRPEGQIRRNAYPCGREYRQRRRAGRGCFQGMAAGIQQRRVYSRRRKVRMRLGRGENVEVDVQRCQPRYDCGKIRCRHTPPV